MKQLIRQSPAILVATAALVVAVTGTAVAGPTATDAGITTAQVRKIAKAVAGAEVTSRSPGLSVASARTANAPTLYAQVTAAGVVTGNSRGITQALVTHPTAPRAGFYCFSGLRSTPKGGVVTLDANVSGGGSGTSLAQVGLGTIRDCPEQTQAFVVTFDPSTGFVDEPFFVAFWF